MLRQLNSSRQKLGVLAMPSTPAERQTVMKRNSFEPDQSSSSLPEAIVDQELLDRLSESLCRAGLRLPALVALEVGRPLAFLGGQLLWVAQPAISLFFSGEVVQRVARMLEEPTAVEALVARLETGETE